MNIGEGTSIDELMISNNFINFRGKFEESCLYIKKDMDKIIKYNTPIPTKDIFEKISNVIDTISCCEDTVTYLGIMKQLDESTYAHFINVSILCNTFGNWMNMSKKDIEVLTVAGTLHDVGKLLIPQEILSKKGKLTLEEYEIIKTHTVKGYDILKNTDFDERIINCALSHHERSSGDGYPYHLRGNSIPPFAKIVALADVYEAMTSVRCYKDKMCPFTVINEMEKEQFLQYGVVYSMTILEGLAETYKGKQVILNTGELATVLDINSLTIGKPSILCKGKIMNLNTEDKLWIEKII